MNLHDALRLGRERLAAGGVPVPERDAALLLGHATGLPRTVLRAEPGREIGPAEEARFLDAVRLRAARRPMSQILGVKEFRSRDFRVTADVLAPRPETEALVEEALRAVAGRAGARVAEAGVGSGALVVSIAADAPDAFVCGSDVSGAALCVAAENVRTHGAGGRVVLRRGDLWAPLADLGPFDVMLSNPPYVRRIEAGEVDPEVLWEPACAVFCDGEPSDLYARIAAEARPLLAPGGVLLLELPGPESAPVIAALRVVAGYADPFVRADLAGHPRVAVLRR
ncbi:MAG: Release factor glutamine methyltransferase [Planctomycetes bacterium]|nr:Release factor glutamine methyltransferase [Planctomycetota bacterium]